MKNITISVPDDLWAQIKDQAAERRLSMNAYIRGLLERNGEPDEDSWVDEIVQLAKESRAEPEPGWKFNRTEMYEEIA